MMVINNIYNKYLDILVKWFEKWQILLHFGKCNCLQSEHGNLDVNYKMGYIIICPTMTEKDTGVTKSAYVKVAEQCGIAVS